VFGDAWEVVWDGELKLQPVGRREGGREGEREGGKEGSKTHLLTYLHEDERLRVFGDAWEVVWDGELKLQPVGRREGGREGMSLFFFMFVVSSNPYPFSLLFLPLSRRKWKVSIP